VVFLHLYLEVAQQHVVVMLRNKEKDFLLAFNCNNTRKMKARHLCPQPQNRNSPGINWHASVDRKPPCYPITLQNYLGYWITFLRLLRYSLFKNICDQAVHSVRKDHRTEIVRPRSNTLAAERPAFNIKL